MDIKLLDYQGREKLIHIDNFEDVVRMTMEVMSGDEILRVIYKDYHEETHDSYPGGRLSDFFDGRYEVYDYRNPQNSLLSNKEFTDRKSSYWNWWTLD